jgi:RNA recognition motif-containing protein
MASIFVAKLDFGVSDDELKELFEQYGTVVKSHIAKDKETGKPRGFAFVEMSSDDETAKAIEGLDGHTINGRSIVVKEAEDRGNSRPQARSFDSNRPRRDDRPQRAERPYTPPVKEDSPFMNEREDTSTSEPVKKTKREKGGKKKVSGLDNSSESRENKMSAYKKSGKKNNFHLDEDDDWELELLKSKKRGWTDEEEEF